MRKILERLKSFKENHPVVFNIFLGVVLGLVMTYGFDVLASTGGSEWKPLWQKLQSYIEGYIGMIAAAFLVLAGLFSFYRGQLAQGGVAILVAAGIFLAPKIASNLAGGTLF